MAYPHHDRHQARQHWQGRAADRRARGAARRGRHTGSEPRWARSDLRARRLLSRLFAVVFVLGVAGFAVAAGQAGHDRDLFIALAMLCAVLTVVAIADLCVIRRREAEEQRRMSR